MKNLLIVLWLLVGSGVASARSEVSLRFSATQMIDGQSELQTIDGESVKLKKRRASDAIRLRLSSDRKVALYPEGVDLEAGAVTPIATLTVPTNMKSANVLMIPDSKNKGYKTVVIDDSKLSNGGVYFLNMSGHQVGVKLEETELSVKPQKAKLFEIPNKKARNTPVRMFSRAAASTEWKKFYSSVWRLVPGRKEIMIFYQVSEVQPIRVYSLTDY